MAEQQFDVFLAHSSKDKPLVRQLYRNLKERNIRPWLDEEEIAPGTRFQEEIQQAIGQIKSVAVCIGKSGMGRWQALELEAFIRRCVEADIRVVPVLLPGVDHIPENLLFLGGFHAVTFETTIDDEKALFRLEWGITRQKPSESHKNFAVEDPLSASSNTDGDELSSEKDIDYTRLRDLLREGKWRDAHQETLNTMFRAAGKDSSGTWFTRDGLQNFPCTDLKTIDSLWRNYSKGHFGFSVQKDIWQKHGGPTTFGKEWDQFCIDIGWQPADTGRYLNYDEFKADPKNSPRGEFPIIFWMFLYVWGAFVVEERKRFWERGEKEKLSGEFWLLFSRIQT